MRTRTRVLIVLAVLVAWSLPAVAGDRDGDGISDEVDRCPDSPEDVDQHRDDDGCPEIVQVDPIPGVAEAPLPVSFSATLALEPGESTLDTRSARAIERVRKTLAFHPTAHIAVEIAPADDAETLAEVLADRLTGRRLDASRLTITIGEAPAEGHNVTFRLSDPAAGN